MASRAARSATTIFPWLINASADDFERELQASVPVLEPQLESRLESHLTP
jgi:hypothetical protein